MDGNPRKVRQHFQNLVVSEIFAVDGKYDRKAMNSDRDCLMFKHGLSSLSMIFISYVMRFWWYELQLWVMHNVRMEAQEFVAVG